MHKWTQIRQKLEQDYLAESLRGRLTYYAVTYRESHDREGRFALRLDGAEIFSSSYFDRWQARCDAEREMTAAGDTADLWRRSWEKATENGGFDQKTFYRAFAEFDSQSVAESLASENAVVRMLALLDRRIGKRMLEKLRVPMQQAPQWLQMIYYIRLEAEHMPLSIERKPMKKGILFDLDGTLWDSSAECTQAWNKCIREQTDRTEQFTLADMHNFMGRQMGAIAALMFPTLPEAERLRILDLCTDSEHAYLREHPAQLYAGERSVMEILAKDYALGVVSNCQDGYIEIYMEQCGFQELFCDYESAGRTGLSKGQNIRLVMERQGITDCIYVGDTQGDADAAKEAGIPFVHAAYGFGTPDACAAAIRDIRELPDAAAKII